MFFNQDFIIFHFFNLSTAKDYFIAIKLFNFFLYYFIFHFQFLSIYLIFIQLNFVFLLLTLK